jgi:hypothetical protein
MDVDPNFLAFLRDEENRAYNGTLLEEVEAAINSYNGADYGDEEEGRSQVVARDVAEVTDYMLTSVLDVFVASGRIVEFEAQNAGDEQQCNDATEAMHYLYRRKSGYRLIHDWAKAGLLEKIGIVKSCVETKRKRVDALYHPALVPDDAIAAEETGQPHPLDGAPMIRAITLEETAAEFPDYHVPLEEFSFSMDTTGDIDASPYLAHHPLKSLSDLIEMGYDRALVESISDDGDSGLSDYSALAQARNDNLPLMYSLGENRPGMLRKVRYREEYTFFDLDGDGIAERLKVCRVGNTVLNVEPVDYQPFEWWCPYPMQGRAVGQSLADKTMDIQRVNTVLERSMLDSLYAQLRPGTFIHEDSCGEHTIDDLLTIAPNRIVRFTGSVPPVPEQRTDVSSVAIQAIEFKTKQRENRTGITQLNRGVDENTLNDTAKGQAQLMSRGQQMERYLIRNFAEGVARLFMKKVGLMRRFGKPFQIRVDGQYHMVDPSQWPEDMEVQVAVGLGSGSKEDRIMFRQSIAQAQSMAMMSQSPVCTWQNVFNNLTALARDMNLQPNDLWTDPTQNPAAQQPQQPDPKTQALMAQVQVKQQEMQMRGAMDQQKLQLEAAKGEGQLQLQAQNAHAQAEIALRQQNLQGWLDTQQMKLEAAKHAATIDSSEKIAKMRPGGALDK